MNGNKEQFDFDTNTYNRWTKSHELLTELGIKKDDLSQIVNEAAIVLR